MKAITFGLAFTFIFSCSQNTSQSYQTETKEIQDFLNNYKRLLQKAKFDSVALLYVDTGFVSLGSGAKDVSSLDTLKSFYSRFPKIENDFYWDDVRIDILNKNAALVTAFFYWHDKGSPDTTKQSYTGVYVKHANQWKIMHEHESVDFMTVAKIIKDSEKKAQMQADSAKVKSSK
jgi:hypothetical protein